MVRHLFALIGITLLFSCENSESDIKALTRKTDQRDMSIQLEGFLSQAGVMRARLTSPYMEKITPFNSSDTAYVEFPRTLHVDFYNEIKEVESRLDSKYGIYYDRLNQIYLRDSVIIISNKGDTVLCEEVWWDQNTQKFHSDKKTIIKSKEIPYYVAEGGFEASQDLKERTLFGTSGKLLSADETPGSGLGVAPGTTTDTVAPEPQ